MTEPEWDFPETLHVLPVNAKTFGERLDAPRKRYIRADAAEAVLDKAAALIEERHVVYMTAKGRNPKDYSSEWSLLAKEVRAMLVELMGESHDPL